MGKTFKLPRVPLPRQTERTHVPKPDKPIKYPKKWLAEELAKDDNTSDKD